LRKNQKYRFKRVWHPCGNWEEIKYGMWDRPVQHKTQLLQAIAFTSNHVEYGKYMRKVTKEWPISCENALTDYSLNRKAWLGHAACALAHRLPESVVREAWKELTDEQQFLANKEAERAIAEWEYAYAARVGLPGSMGKALLFE